MATRTYSIDMDADELRMVKLAMEMAEETFLDMINDDDTLTPEAKTAQAWSVGRFAERVKHIGPS